MSVAFLVTTVIMTATPGIGVVYTLSVALARGGRAAVVAAFGCTLGLLPHVAASLAGLAALLRTGAVAFEAVRWAGVAYLLWMAWSTLRAGPPPPVAEGAALRPAAIIGRAVLVNLLNPKLTLFFVAFLPQFVPAGAPDATIRLLVLSGVAMLVTFAVFAAYGLAAGAARRHVLGRPGVLRWLRRTLAGSFLALGVSLALSAR